MFFISLRPISYCHYAASVALTRGYLCGFLFWTNVTFLGLCGFFGCYVAFLKRFYEPFYRKRHITTHLSTRPSVRPSVGPRSKKSNLFNKCSSNFAQAFYMTICEDIILALGFETFRAGPRAFEFSAPGRDSEFPC